MAIYINSYYAFATTHMYGMTGMIPRKRGLLTAREKDIKTFKTGNLGPPRGYLASPRSCYHQKDYSPEARDN